MAVSSSSSSSSSSPSRNLEIGIVGFGPFAQFLAKIMIKQGHTLRATSRSDHSSICQDLGISFFRLAHIQTHKCLQELLLNMQSL